MILLIHFILFERHLHTYCRAKQFANDYGQQRIIISIIDTVSPAITITIIIIVSLSSSSSSYHHRYHHHCVDGGNVKRNENPCTAAIAMYFYRLKSSVLYPVHSFALQSTGTLNAPITISLFPTLSLLFCWLFYIFFSLSLTHSFYPQIDSYLFVCKYTYIHSRQTMVYRCDSSLALCH